MKLTFLLALLGLSFTGYATTEIETVHEDTGYVCTYTYVNGNETFRNTFTYDSSRHSSHTFKVGKRTFIVFFSNPNSEQLVHINFAETVGNQTYIFANAFGWMHAKKQLLNWKPDFGKTYMQLYCTR